MATAQDYEPGTIAQPHAGSGAPACCRLRSIPAWRRRVLKDLRFRWVLILGLSAACAMGETKPPADAHLHWAFQPPQVVTPPPVQNTRWVRTDIDRFILSKLEAARLSPAPPADPRTLMRRISFDLTGMPPTGEDVAQFVAESKQDRQGAITRLTERLLASPAYGERWGRHWLDVARYSDTKGYVYAREERHFVHAFAYRDWVIRAFNEDLPYDRFLLLQIAADQLTPADSPDLAAMGFVTGGRRFIGVTHDIIDDRIDVVTRGTMGLTVQCARCHDHKYDPIPTRDYYSLYGVFHGCDDRLVALAPDGDAELAKRRAKLASMMGKRRDEASARLRSRVGDYLAAQLELEKYPEEGFDQLFTADDLIPASVRRWRDFLGRPGVHPVLRPWLALAALPAADFESAARGALTRALEGGTVNPLVAAAFTTPPRDMRETAARYGALFANLAQMTNAPGAAELRAFLNAPDSPAVVPETGIVNNEGFFPTAVVEELWKLQGEVDRRLIELGIPAALVLAEREPEPNPRVFERGRAARLGESVPRQFLEVLSGPKRRPFQNDNGRLELARAIASPDNPLTARVMVNRIWQHHFGTGLVRTPSDFGLRAGAPSHPELLDWLARRFVEEHWSVKAMHRLIVSSAVYQQSSTPVESVVTNSRHATARNEARTGAPKTEGRVAGDSARPDPENGLLSHFPIHRLEFEALRDAMLAASGELDSTLGGRAIDLLDARNKRRTVYALVDRQFLPGAFRTFDFANPDIHVATRHETTVPQQALYFLNGSFAAQRAQALARRFHGSAPAERVQLFHQALFQRAATRGEVAAALRFISAAAADPLPERAPERKTSWSYGYGDYDESGHRTKSFTALPHFTGTAWQGAEAYPGGESGWAQLTADGGHPGNDARHACIRRWTAPREATVSISGILKHEPEQGEGVRGFIVSSRHGELKSATVHKSKASMTATNVVLQAGDTIDFVVGIGPALSYNQFLWAPLIAAEDAKWDARAEFTGPASAVRWLDPWEQYAQVLMLSNEFAFVD